MTGLELKALALVALVAVALAGAAYRISGITNESSRSIGVSSARIVHLSEFLAAGVSLQQSEKDDRGSELSSAAEAKFLRLREAAKSLLSDYQYDGSIFARYTALDDIIVQRLSETRRYGNSQEQTAGGANDVDLSSVMRLTLDLLNREQQHLEHANTSGDSAPAWPDKWIAFFGLLSAAILVVACLLIGEARQWIRRARKPDAARFIEPGQKIADRNALVAGIQASIVSSLNKSRTIGLMYIELKNLDEVRTSLGPATTDQVTGDVCDVLRSEFRRSDLVARLEGDVLVVMASDVSQRSDLASFADRIRRALDAFVIAALPEIRLTAEIGAAMYPIGGYSAEDMITSARASMSQVKSTSGTVVPFSRPLAQPA